MTAVIYARFSSDNQREESITAQVRACTEYARQRGYPVVKVYTDEARSATTDDRPGFLKMIEDIKSGRLKVDILLVHKLDRFARNRYDSAFYKRELRQAGARVESVLEHLDDSPESILMESVIEGMAEYYSRNLAREVMKGMKETALQGKHTGGKPPLGYDVDSDGRYIANETEARAVRMIFEMYGRGKSYGYIIDALNSCGFRTKADRPFGKNSIHDILRNKKYIGIYTFNRSAAKKNGHRNHHLSKPKEDLIEIPDAIPPIIEKNLFLQVQEQMNTNRTGPGRAKAKVDYLLSGLIWCGECNHRMTGASSSYQTKKSKEYKQRHYYTCNYGNRTKQCSNEKIVKDLVESYVLAELERQIFNEEVLPVLAEKIVQYYSRQQIDYAGDLQQMEKELAGVKKEIDNLVNALAAGGVAVQSIVEKLKGLETKKSIVEAHLQEWQLKAEANIISVETAIAYLQVNMRLLQNKNPDTCKRLIREFVEKVIVTQEKIEVVFKITVDMNGGGGGIRTHRPKEEPQDLLRA